MQPQESMHPTFPSLWSRILILMGPFRFPMGRDTRNGWGCESTRSSGNVPMGKQL